MRNTTRRETEAAVSSSLTRESDLTLAESNEIDLQVLSPHSASPNPPKLRIMFPSSISILIGLRVAILELNWGTVQRLWRITRRNLDREDDGPTYGLRLTLDVGPWITPLCHWPQQSQ